MSQKSNRTEKFVISFTAQLLNIDENEVTPETVIPDMFLLSMFFIKNFPPQKTFAVTDNVEKIYTVKKAIEIFKK